MVKKELENKPMSHVKNLCKDFYLLGIQHACLTIFERNKDKIKYDKLFEKAWNSK